jgi:hypothetical protein
MIIPGQNVATDISKLITARQKMDRDVCKHKVRHLTSPVSAIQERWTKNKRSYFQLSVYTFRRKTTKLNLFSAYNFPDHDLLYYWYTSFILQNLSR